MNNDAAKVFTKARTPFPRHGILKKDHLGEILDGNIPMSRAVIELGTYGNRLGRTMTHSTDTSTAPPWIPTNCHCCAHRLFLLYPTTVFLLCPFLISRVYYVLLFIFRDCTGKKKNKVVEEVCGVGKVNGRN